jgi:hypothetical protein
LVCTTWKARPLTVEQRNQLMALWGKVEVDQAENTSLERVCWYMFSDGSGGFTVVKANDIEAANAWGLEVGLALGDLIELENKVVLELEAAMPAIQKALERLNG